VPIRVVFIIAQVREIGDCDADVAPVRKLAATGLTLFRERSPNLPAESARAALCRDGPVLAN
jgi:hypothetical protein